MRTDLQINYDTLDAVSAGISDYYNALDEIEKSINSLKNVLENQESQAYSRLWENVNSVTLDLTVTKDT